MNSHCALVLVLVQFFVVTAAKDHCKAECQCERRCADSETGSCSTTMVVTTKLKDQTGDSCPGFSKIEEKVIECVKKRKASGETQESLTVRKEAVQCYAAISSFIYLQYPDEDSPEQECLQVLTLSIAKRGMWDLDNGTSERACAKVLQGVVFNLMNRRNRKETTELSQEKRCLKIFRKTRRHRKSKEKTSQMKKCIELAKSLADGRHIMEVKIDVKFSKGKDWDSDCVEIVQGEHKDKKKLKKCLAMFRKLFRRHPQSSKKRLYSFVGRHKKSVVSLLDDSITGAVRKAERVCKKDLTRLLCPQVPNDCEQEKALTSVTKPPSLEASSSSDIAASKVKVSEQGNFPGNNEEQEKFKVMPKGEMLSELFSASTEANTTDQTENLSTSTSKADLRSEASSTDVSTEELMVSGTISTDTFQTSTVSSGATKSRSFELESIEVTGPNIASMASGVTLASSASDSIAVNVTRPELEMNTEATDGITESTSTESTESSSTDTTWSSTESTESHFEGISASTETLEENPGSIDFIENLEGSSRFTESTENLPKSFGSTESTESLQRTFGFTEYTEDLEGSSRFTETTENLEGSSRSTESTESLQRTFGFTEPTKNLEGSSRFTEFTENFEGTSRFTESTENLEESAGSTESTENLGGNSALTDNYEGSSRSIENLEGSTGSIESTENVEGTSEFTESTENFETSPGSTETIESSESTQTSTLSSEIRSRTSEAFNETEPTENNWTISGSEATESALTSSSTESTESTWTSFSTESTESTWTSSSTESTESAFTDSGSEATDTVTKPASESNELTSLPTVSTATFTESTSSGTESTEESIPITRSSEMFNYTTGLENNWPTSSGASAMPTSVETLEPSLVPLSTSSGASAMPTSVETLESSLVPLSTSYGASAMPTSVETLEPSLVPLSTSSGASAMPTSVETLESSLVPLSTSSGASAMPTSVETLESTLVPLSTSSGASAMPTSVETLESSSISLSTSSGRELTSASTGTMSSTELTTAESASPSSFPTTSSPENSVITTSGTSISGSTELESSSPQTFTDTALTGTSDITILEITASGVDTKIETPATTMVREFKETPDCSDTKVPFIVCKSDLERNVLLLYSAKNYPVKCNSIYQPIIMTSPPTIIYTGHLKNEMTPRELLHMRGNNLTCQDESPTYTAILTAEASRNKDSLIWMAKGIKPCDLLKIHPMYQAVTGGEYEIPSPQLNTYGSLLKLVFRLYRDHPTTDLSNVIIDSKVAFYLKEFVQKNHLCGPVAMTEYYAKFPRRATTSIGRSFDEDQGGVKGGSGRGQQKMMWGRGGQQKMMWGGRGLQQNMWGGGQGGIRRGQQNTWRGGQGGVRGVQQRMWGGQRRRGEGYPRAWRGRRKMNGPRGGWDREYQ